ncbi:MAG TPA: glycoside hydrolase family 127 protein [Actinophytocola sp.]|nr:glycoside hydrolase family 127 protein [Actinophytocola sp.]
MPEFTRRTLIQLAGVTVAGSALPLAVPSTAAAVRPDIGVSVFPFPLTQVSLLDSPFRANMTRTLSYLSFVDADRLLHTFRLNYGLSSTAQPVGGWDAPDVELRGHSTGHLLTGLAQAFANTGDAQYKTKGDYIVGVLATCQARANTAGFNTGFLSAWPESMIDRVEAGTSVWAPYYTLHKIMAGLLDMHLMAGNAQALDVLTRMAAWVKFRTDRLSATQIQTMLRTEFGGMNEVLTNLYAVTSNADHLTIARRFDHAQIFDPLAANQDRLAGFHANTQIPKIIGAIREYHQTGTDRYRTIAVNFFDIVIGHHTYAIGGNSNGEFFQQPDAIASQLSDNTCETCNTYNMLKLARQLFFTNPTRVDYLDYYERGLYNQILGQQNPNSSHGFVAYYQPLRPGGIKTYSNDYNNFTCDHGTGMESHTKFADSIYFFAGETLYVNLLIPSVLNWSGRGITVRQDSAFPDTPSTRLTVTGSGHIALKIRIPSWARQGTTVRLNGAVQNVTVTPNTFLTLDRNWVSGDTVEVAFSPTLSFEPTPDNSAVQAVKFGGIVLAGEYGTNNLGSMPRLDTATVRPDPGRAAAVHRDREHRQRVADPLLPHARPALHGLLADQQRSAASGVHRRIPIQRDVRHQRRGRHRQRPHRHALRWHVLGGRPQRGSGQPQRNRRPRPAAERNPGRGQRLHRRRLGAAGCGHHLVPDLRHRQRHRRLPVPHPAQQRRHRPVRHHHRRRGRRAADQRSGRVARQHLDPCGGHALRQPRRALRQRNRSRPQRQHHRAPGLAGQHRHELPR